ELFGKSHGRRGAHVQTYALLGNVNHMIRILKRLLATRWRCDYSCTTPARPDLQRSSFSGIGCGKETVNGNGPTPTVSSRVGELLCHVERICQSGSDRDISNAPLFRIRDSSTALGMTKGCSPQIIRIVRASRCSKSSAPSAVFTTLAMRVHRAMPGAAAPL